MSDEDRRQLLENAGNVLKHNDRGSHTVPAKDLYPHQWFWDSCFIAIGLRHTDVKRAQLELTNLLRGQWSNGMFPNIIFNDNAEKREKELWRSYLSPYSPSNVFTSGITQPPVLAEAVVKIGEKLKLAERRSWYRQMYPHLIRYHEWLYHDRDPHNEGLVVLLHPYESGLDNSPPWISELRKHSMPWWIRLMERLHLDVVVNLFRRDTKHVPPGQRMSNIEALTYWAAIHRLRRKAYNSEALLSRSLFTVEDLAFNAILVRANTCLEEMAKSIKKDLPEELMTHIARSREAFEQFWSESDGQYYSRSFVSHKLIEEPTISTLLTLYSGAISKERAARMVELINKPRCFKAEWPLPSVPQTSAYFESLKYWQGPTWINTNWLVIEGLKNYGYHEEAKKLQEKSLELVKNSDFYEYFSPIDGTPAGAPNFSWTAALTVDLLKN